MERLLVHEHFSGGGLSGRPLPAAMAREGAAMRDALLEDLARLGRFRLLVTADPRLPPRKVPPGVEIVGSGVRIDRILPTVDLAWLIAPETRGCLERLAARALDAGTRIVGPGPDAIRRAADKAALALVLERRGIPHAPSRSAASHAECVAAARALGFPLVVKPARGAGSEGVGLARSARRLAPAVRAARLVAAGPVLVQGFVAGLAASVSLVCDGRRARVLTVNAQSTLASRPFAYRGGTTPLEHPLARRAAVVARRACEAIHGLRGFVGVDVVLGEREAVVIEVNPRLTTAYLGVRAALDANVAGLALAAWEGRMPAVPRARRAVRFTSAGRVVAA